MKTSFLYGIYIVTYEICVSPIFLHVKLNVYIESHLNRHFLRVHVKSFISQLNVIAHEILHFMRF